MKKYIDIEVEITGSRGWIYFNRPNAKNAFSELMIVELVEALHNLDQDQKIKVIILSGRGDAFNAGGDIKSMLNRDGMFAGDSNELRLRYKYGIQTIPHAMEKLSTPVIAMINGSAIGAGLDVTCMCDIRVASENAVFGETFCKIGLVPGDGGTYFLQRIVGFAKAMEMTLTAKLYNASEALQMGLVNKVVPLANLKSEVEQYCQMIESNVQMSISMSKRALIHSYQNDLNSVLELLSSFQAISQRSPDHLSALEKFKK